MERLNLLRCKGDLYCSHKKNSPLLQNLLLADVRQLTVKHTHIIVPLIWNNIEIRPWIPTNCNYMHISFHQKREYTIHSFWIEFRHLEAAASEAAEFRSWYRSEEMAGGGFSSPGSLIKCQYSLETKGTDGRWQCNYSLIMHSWLITTVQGFQLLPVSHWTTTGWSKHKKNIAL
jgi:hypothetical protein